MHKIGLLFIISILLLEVRRSPFLIKECSGPAPRYFEYSETADFTQVGKVVFFSTMDQANGRELWKTDGTPEGTALVKDINPGISSSKISNAISFKNRLLFFDSDGSPGLKLWTSDGTASGTFILKDIDLASISLEPFYFLQWKKALYFVAGSTPKNYGLWRTDGTAQGTYRAVDFADSRKWERKRAYQIPETTKPIFEPDVSSAIRAGIRSAIMGSYLYYTGGFDLWKTDGSNEATQVIAHATSTRPEALLTELAALDSTLLFVARDQHGRELWKSDGTPEGTSFLKDILDGEKSSDPRNLTRYEQMIFFSADDGVHGREIWVTDGTADGTHMLKDIAPGSASSNPKSFMVSGSEIYFMSLIGRQETLNCEQSIWRTDGTEQGTRALYSFNVDCLGTVTYNKFLVIPKGLIFKAPSNGNICMFRYDSDSDKLDCFYKPLQEAGNTIAAAPAFGGLIFSEYEHLTGTKLIISDGTERRTSSFALSPNAHLNCSIGELFPFKGQVYFIQDLNEKDDKISALWKSDGTSKGTGAVHDISGWLLGIIGNTFYFAAEKYGLGYSGNELWSSHGTSEGATLVQDINPGRAGSYPSNLIDLPPWILFTAKDSDDIIGLWQLNPSSHSATMIRELTKERIWFANDFIKWKNKIYFLLRDINNEYVLWKTDGTKEGTASIRSLYPLGPSTEPEVKGTPGLDFFFFKAIMSSYGHILLWRSDGTAEGTFPVRASNGSYLQPWSWIEYHSILYLASYDSGIGAELWRSDGTASGSYLLKDINPGAGGSDLFFRAQCGNVIYFSASDGIHGQELWKTDGTANGTVMVKDINPGLAGSMTNRNSNMAICNGAHLLFSASDGLHGLELWESDGTEQGTRMIKDFATGPSSSNPEGFVLSGNYIYFKIKDSIHGESLWGLKHR
jgi:ELWxxDGT repeat protein